MAQIKLQQIKKPSKIKPIRNAKARYQNDKQ